MSIVSQMDGAISEIEALLQEVPEKFPLKILSSPFEVSTIPAPQPKKQKQVIEYHAEFSNEKINANFCFWVEILATFYVLL